MAIAGKVAITLSTENRGAWSADVTYDRLVAVKHNNNLYISRKTVANVEPPNDEFWFLALEGYSGADVQALIDRLNELSDLIQAIITGTQQVGNAKTLDGHGAEFFAPLSYFANRQLKKNVLNTVDEINAFYNDLHANALDASVYEGWVANNVGHPILGGGQFYVLGARTSALYGWQKAISYSLNFKEYERALENGTWGAWKDVFTTDGGTITTNSNNKLPQLPLELVNGVNENGSVIRFDDQKGTLGHIGFVEKNKPIFSDVNGNVKDLLHTGNKPTGTYIGNGDATERTIATGGIGHFAVVWAQGSNDSITLLTTRGGYVKKGTAISGLNRTSGRMQDGVIYISTTDLALNQNGVAYQYEVH